MTSEEMHEKYPLPDPRMRWKLQGKDIDLYGVYTEGLYSYGWWTWWVYPETGTRSMSVYSHSFGDDKRPVGVAMPGATEEECYAFIHQHILLGIQL